MGCCCSKSDNDEHEPLMSDTWRNHPTSMNGHSYVSGDRCDDDFTPFTSGTPNSSRSYSTLGGIGSPLSPKRRGDRNLNGVVTSPSPKLRKEDRITDSKQHESSPKVSKASQKFHRRSTSLTGSSDSANDSRRHDTSRRFYNRTHSVTGANQGVPQYLVPQYLGVSTSPIAQRVRASSIMRSTSVASTVSRTQSNSPQRSPNKSTVKGDESRGGQVQDTSPLLKCGRSEDSLPTMYDKSVDKSPSKSPKRNLSVDVHNLLTPDGTPLQNHSRFSQPKIDIPECQILSDSLVTPTKNMFSFPLPKARSLLNLALLNKDNVLQENKLTPRKKVRNSLMCDNFLAQFEGKRMLSSNDFMKIWENYDRDGDGYISDAELNNLLRDLLDSHNLQALHADERVRPAIKDGAEISDDFIAQYRRVIIEFCGSDKLDMAMLAQILPVESSFLLNYNNDNQTLCSVDFMKLYLHYDPEGLGYISDERLEVLLYDLLCKHGKTPSLDLLISYKLSILAAYDRNNNKRIDMDEMALICGEEENFLLQFCGRSSFSSNIIKRIFDHYDRNADGRLDGVELTAFIRDLTTSKGEAVVLADINEYKLAILELCNQNGNNSITPDNLKKFLEQLYN